ncbi:MAG: hypothetical protein WB696_06835 [Chthoniobacterales bacterium]
MARGLGSPWIAPGCRKQRPFDIKGWYAAVYLSVICHLSFVMTATQFGTAAAIFAIDDPQSFCFLLYRLAAVGRMRQNPETAKNF